MKKYICYFRHLCCFSAILIAMLLFSGFAESEPELESDGWIFQTIPMSYSLSADDSIFNSITESPGDSVEPVWDDVYKTNNRTLLDELNQSGLLLYAEPDYWVDLEDIPDDPYLFDGSQYAASMIGLDYGWNAGITGQNVRVGVLDSGLYSEHEDFIDAHIIDGWNFCDDSADISDKTGHGTLISGIIAAQINNGFGIAGIAPDVQLVPLKCFSTNRGTVSDIVKALIESVDSYHCDVLNLSFGMKTNSKSLQDAITYVQEHNVLLIAAAGNLPAGTYSTGDDPLMYPAAYEAVTGVGAVDVSKNVASFSCQNPSVLVTAPGKKIIGPGYTKTDSYITKNGTSFAAPEVTAAAALARSIDPSLSNEEFQRLLSETSEDLGNDGYDPVYGYGLLHVDRLLLKLQNELDPNMVYGYVNDLKPDTSIFAVVAAYNSNGTISDVKFQSMRTDKDGSACISVLFPKKTDAFQVRLMILDETYSPLCKAVNIK